MKETATSDSMPYVIVGNKCDKDRKVSAQRVEEEWIKSGRASAHFLTCAEDNKTVELAFKTVT